MLVGILAIISFFILPANNRWLYGKILDKNNNVFVQAKRLGLDERKEDRFGYSYMVYMNAIKLIKNPEDAIVLFPPGDYVKSVLHVNNFVVPEPAVFYYYTGLVSVWANSPDVERANWEVVVKRENDIVLRKITSKRHLDSMIIFFRKYLNEGP